LVIIGLFGASVAAGCSSDEGDDTPATGGSSGSAGKGGAAGKGGSAGTGGSGPQAGEAGQGVGGTSGSAGAGASAGEAGSPTTGGGGEAGAAGGAGGAGTLSGLNVLFIGMANASGPDTEAELIALVTNETGKAPARIHPDGTASALKAADLAGADVAVLDSLQRDYSGAEATVLSDWVEDGHGLLILTGFATDERASPFADRFDVEIGDTVLGNLSTLVSDFPNHPVTEGVSSLLFGGGYSSSTTDNSAVELGSVQGKTAGLALTAGSGRVVVWGDDWVTLSAEMNRTEDGKHPAQRFWQNVLSWTSGTN